MNELISIIIPTYNRAHLISETLDSIVAQTYPYWECIVVDDGSTDNTADVLAKYIEKDNRFQYHQRPIDRIKGPNPCRNYGFELSKGEFIKWFDSDDIMLPNLLEKQILSFEKNVDVSVCKLKYYDFSSGIFIKENVIFSKYLIEDYFTGKIAFYVSGPIWKRRFLEKQIDLFDESITNLDDWDFNLRMLYQNPVIKFIDESLIEYRIHENSLSLEIGKLNFSEICSEMKAREKHFEIISKNKIANPDILRNYITWRYRALFREAMIQNHPKKRYLFMKLIRNQLWMFDVFGILKSFFEFFVYSLFNKGYILLK
ncbi:MAG TPA: glycosyltransferase [Flavobacterium sp.]|uniref:glycosyltransferase family 2 protein n=1 Tax=Flavobacterium sp. TaxID=239 RepID=UPI002DBF1542|nr:glycosyltransferase [Flavobacterium sp.]HEU4790433.1 glycosyltransferase [Flavobacterium sp.]